MSAVARKPYEQGDRYFAAAFPEEPEECAEEGEAFEGYFVFDSECGGDECAGPFTTHEEAWQRAEELNAQEGDQRQRGKAAQPKGGDALMRSGAQIGHVSAIRHNCSTV